MWARVFLLILLPCAAPALAQTVPDFSGVFLRNLIDRHGPFADPADPLVLIIKQGVENLQITEMQNGAQRTYVYDITSKPSIHVTPDGVYTKDRMKFKDGRLLIESEVVANDVFADRLTRETWELSPDLRGLTIRIKGVSHGSEVRDSRRMETYTRQTSLGEALEKAQWASGMTQCNANNPFTAKLPTPRLDHGGVLGVTGFQQLGWEVSFGAALSGDFFDGVERTNASGVVELRKKGKLIPTYSGSLILEVTPLVSSYNRWKLWTLSAIMGDESLPEWLQTLRFRVKWVGSEFRDLGEVRSGLEQQPWPEWNAPITRYRLEIPAQDVPITDSLEVQILSASGNQLGCISGHL